MHHVLVVVLLVRPLVVLVVVAAPAADSQIDDHPGDTALVVHCRSRGPHLLPYRQQKKTFLPTVPTRQPHASSWAST